MFHHALQKSGKPSQPGPANPSAGSLERGHGASTTGARAARYPPNTMKQTMRTISSNVTRPNATLANFSRHGVSPGPPAIAAKHGVPRAPYPSRGLPGSSPHNSILIHDRAPKDHGIKKLHEAVYFDENDFDDDAELDLEYHEPPAMPNLQQYMYPPQAPAQTPQGCLQSSARESGRLPSSAPVPWSSSPLAHKVTPPNAATLKRAAPSPEPHVMQTATRPATDEPNPRSKKRRTIPWIGLEGAEPERLVPAGKPKASEHAPWDQTASAVKAEQKRLRQAKKKLVKDNDATEEDHRQAIASKKRKCVIPLFLSDEQKKILHMVVEKGQSVFFTGSAGTGKSVLLREIIAKLRTKYHSEPDRVAVTASTGLAACNVGGVTLHSFGGIGLGKEGADELVNRIRKNAKAKTRWLRTKVLIIDEISMVDGDLFDKLEAIAKKLRRDGRPFGGIQLVITGDFFQLPPVPDSGRISRFAFDAATWSTSIDHIIGLTQVFRQKDPVFAGMLNEMRVGKLSQKSIDIFRGLNRPIHYDDDLDGTELFPTRGEVDAANSARMRNLQGDFEHFVAVDGGRITDALQRTKLLANCMAPIELRLKKHAQVMLIKNIDESLVNGSLGKVIGFMDETTFGLEKQDDDVPGDYFDESAAKQRARIKPSTSMGPSRVPSRRWPLVRFAMSDGSTRDLLCQPETWNIELPNGEVQASRTQVPLILAWALSIHKAQGQTLDRVKVDLGRVFEKGQAYVALSRATSQDGLQVLRFDPRKVMAHERVRSFYESLSSVHEAIRPPARLDPTAPLSRFERDYLEGQIDEDAERAVGYA